MLELFAGGLVGLVVAVVTQWTATGGRLKRLRTTIRDELELLRLIGGDSSDPVWEKLRVQTRIHVLEYLDDPSVDGTADVVRKEIFRPTWGVLCAAASGLLFWLGATDTGPELGGVAGLLVGFGGTIALGVVARLATHFVATHIARRRYSKGIRAAVKRREVREEIATGKPDADE